MPVKAVRLRWSIISPVVPGRYLNPLPGLTDSGAKHPRELVVPVEGPSVLLLILSLGLEVVSCILLLYNATALI